MLSDPFALFKFRQAHSRFRARYNRRVRRIAWFSPLSPSRSGVAAYTEEIVPCLRAHYHIDVYDHQRAHDFVWQHHRQPYDLIVYQFGNSPAHDHAWAYVTRYPGLVVLHDAQLHQSRALQLLREHRESAYRAELAFSHPDVPAGVADLVIAGLGGSLFFLWPMLRPVIETARLVGVHNAHLAAALEQQFPTTPVSVISMGVGEVATISADVRRIRARHRIPDDAVVFECVGLVTRGKRVNEILQALVRVVRYRPNIRLMFVGDQLGDIDPLTEARALGLSDHVIVTGYVGDDELASHLAAADACLCLRWPSAHETSAAWLRCLAAGRPTVITDLAMTADVPRIDARTWLEIATRRKDGTAQEPMCVSVGILDEIRSIELALAHLAADRALRERLGRNARGWWSRHHTLEKMELEYEAAIERAMTRPAPTAAVLPPHFREDYSDVTRGILSDFGLDPADLFADRQRVS
jgi:glycosyltransferase involved in cell wall biosynthesis